MGNRVLLINPNQYHHPPVIPIGLEYISHALRQGGHEPRLLDLCFEGTTSTRIADEVASLRPDAVCITVRNLDSVLYPDTEYFLPAIKETVAEIRRHTDAPVICGGAAMGADPEGIRAFLGADAGVIGPGEATLVKMLLSPGTIRGSGELFQGALPEDYIYERKEASHWQNYIDNGGLGGFTTHSGCSSGCPYCIEACTPVMLRDPEHVALEVASLLDSGMGHLHLCDPEFNEDVAHAVEVLRKIIKKAPGLKWTLYMRPGHWSPALFELLARSGAYLVTLSIDTCPHSSDYLGDVSQMIRVAKDNGIQICVDLLAGLPGEDEDALVRTMDALSSAKPKEVVINTTVRLARTTPVTSRILADEQHREFLIGKQGDHGSLLSPVFYQRITPEQLSDITANDPMFRISGEEKIVNYQINDGQINDGQINDGQADNGQPDA